MSRFAEYSPDPVRRGIPLASMGLIIREARAADVAPVARIAGEREEQPVEHFVRATADLLARKARGDAVDMKVAEFGGEVIGFGKSGYITPPPRSPSNCIPEGWYLTGLVVDPKFRRKRVGHELTRARIEWLFQRTESVYYFANSRNHPTITLHDHFGFKEVSRDIWVPKVTFSGTGSVGVLYGLNRDRESGSSP